MRDMARHVGRVVIKVGTSLLSGGGPGLDRRYVRRLAQAFAAERRRGVDTVLVTSGAIGAGLEALGLEERPRSLRHLQAAAAVGQGALMHAYAEAFGLHGLVAAQILLTRDGIENRERYLNARNTLLTLLEAGAVPVVNENDTVSVEEIRFGDNDTLAALVTELVDADMLIILTDVDGLYTGDPRSGDARLIAEVHEVTPELEAVAGGAGTKLGSGGMVTKLAAARMVTAAGASMVLAGGADPGVINRILEGEEIGTFFHPRGRAYDARRFWIAFGNARCGAIRVNDGAVKALVEQGKSLLPVGIVAVQGAFAKGDTVSVVSEDGREFARGITCYASPEVEKMRGRRSSELPALLGAAYSEEEVIHRDNLVIL